MACSMYTYTFQQAWHITAAIEEKKEKTIAASAPLSSDVCRLSVVFPSIALQALARIIKRAHHTTARVNESNMSKSENGFFHFSVHFRVTMNRSTSKRARAMSKENANTPTAIASLHVESSPS